MSAKCFHSNVLSFAPAFATHICATDLDTNEIEIFQLRKINGAINESPCKGPLSREIAFEIRFFSVIAVFTLEN